MNRVTDCEFLLTLLRAAHGTWVRDLYASHMMVHSRIADLRRQGHRIECRCFGRRDYRYRLVEGKE